MRVIADREKCIASGDCVALCPQVFGQDDEGNVVVLDAEPPEELGEAVQDAVDGCPVGCLAVEH